MNNSTNGSELEEVLQRRFGSHAVISLFSSVISKILGLILIKILTNTLPPDEFGYYSIWISFAFLVATFSTRAFSASLWRFLPRRRLQSDDGASRLVGASFLGSYLLLSLVFTAMFILFQFTGIMVYSDVRYLTTLLFAMFLSACYVGVELVLVISGSEQNAKEILTFSLFYFGLSTITAIMSIVFFSDYRSVILWLSFGFIVPVSVSILIKIRKYGIKIPSKSDIKEIFNFGGPSVIVSSIVTLQPYVAYFLIGIYLGTSEIGSLSIALSLSTIFAFIISPPLVAYQSYLVNAYETKNMETTVEITSLTMRFFLIAAVLIAWLTIVFSPTLIVILSSAQYLSGVIVVPFVVLASTIVAFSTFAKVRIDIAEKPQYTAYSYIVSLIFLLAVCLLLVPSTGFIGVGLAILCQSLIIVVMLFYYGSKQIPFKLDTSFVFQLSISSLFLVASYYILKLVGIQSPLDSIISAGLYVIILVLSRALDIGSLRKLKWLIIG